MSHITEQKCPNCGAPMRFDPASGMLVCDNCGNKVDVSEKPSESAAATPPEAFRSASRNAPLPLR